MAVSDNSDPARLLLPFLQRADELQTHQPLVAYYCRLYAMERGIRIPKSDRTNLIDTLLVSLMNQLERDKKLLVLGVDDKLDVEGFALSVFEKADNQDRAGRANLNTAKTFYAASIFLEILNQFGDLHPDLEQKQKYATWKAADIGKALKEGRKPVPGTPAGDKDQPMPSRSTSTGDCEINSIGLNPSRTDSSASNLLGLDLSAQPYNQDNLQHCTDIPPRTPDAAATSTSLSISPKSGLPNAKRKTSGKQKYEHDSSSYRPSAQKIADAQKAARFAVGALAFDDVAIAVDYLKKSLLLLTDTSMNID